MWAYIRHRRVEIKYLLLGVGSVGGLLLLSSSGVLRGLDVYVYNLLGVLTRWGLPGIFLGAVLSNSVLLVNVPYTLVVLSAVLVNDSLVYMAGLSLASGGGAALGKLFAYTVASGVVAQMDTSTLTRSALYRRILARVNGHPRLVPLTVFGAMVTPLPNDLILLPLAAMNYPLRRIALPTIAGKVLHSLSLALCLRYLVDLGGERVTQSVRIDLSLSLLVMSALIVLYQIEKSRQGERKSGRDQIFPPRHSLPA